MWYGHKNRQMKGWIKSDIYMQWDIIQPEK